MSVRWSRVSGTLDALINNASSVARLMNRRKLRQKQILAVLTLSSAFSVGHAFADENIKGSVRGGGDNPAIALLAVLGSKPPTHVVINEMTTVASVWTNAQFLVGATLKGPSLGLRIAAG